MWGLFHLFFMTLLRDAEGPYVTEPLHYKIHAPYPEHQPVPVRHMYQRKGFQRVRSPTQHVLHHLIKMN